MYQFGKNLERSPKGNVDTGLGKNVAYGAIGVLMPTQLITMPEQELVIDGVRFVFHNVPGAEAPAELTFSIPDKKAYGGAENLAQTMHNLLPVRGANVRDSLQWSTYLQEAIDTAGRRRGLFRPAQLAGVGQRAHRRLHHQAPRRVQVHARPDRAPDQRRPHAARDRRAGQAAAVAGVLLRRAWLLRRPAAQRQGRSTSSISGPTTATPPTSTRCRRRNRPKRWLDLIGGADKAVAAAQTAYDQGDYRWAAELLNHAVFGAPEHKGAKELLARTYEQLGYMAEAATWRNSYLTAAMELREGPPQKGIDRSFVIDMLQQTPIERFLEAMAAGLDGPAADGKNLKVNLVLTDIEESYVLWIENAVLHFKKAAPATDANATLTLTKPIFIKMMTGTAGVQDTLLSDDLEIDGSQIDLVRFFTLFDKAPGTFAIVTTE